jgi:hypothetical protein
MKMGELKMMKMSKTAKSEEVNKVTELVDFSIVDEKGRAVGAKKIALY